jgi:hypothetical protein
VNHLLISLCCVFHCQMFVPLLGIFPDTHFLHFSTLNIWAANEGPFVVPFCSSSSPTLAPPHELRREHVASASHGRIPPRFGRGATGEPLRARRPRGREPVTTSSQRGERSGCSEPPARRGLQPPKSKDDSGVEPSISLSRLSLERHCFIFTMHVFCANRTRQCMFH